MARKGAFSILLCLICFCPRQYLLAQVCVDDYFVTDYNTQTVQYPATSLYTAQNEIILTGSVLKPNSILREGWLSKLSAQGTLLWSKVIIHGHTIMCNSQVMWLPVTTRTSLQVI